MKVVPVQTEFSAKLSGITAGTDSPAIGLTPLRLNPTGDVISYQLSVQGIENITMAHIHISDLPGADGPPAVWLYPPAPPAQLIPGQFSGLLGQGDITVTNLVGPLAGKTIPDLLTAIRENRAYVNVHTEQFPGGAIRGQLEALPPQPPIIAVLSGAHTGTDSSATGQVLLKISPFDDAISYELNVQGIENVNMAHIHIAATPGGDGPPAVWLYPSAPPALLIPGHLSGLVGQGEITAANLVGPLAGKTLTDLLIAIQENRAYVNLHTEQFPTGEIRGQLH
ncbi:MAG: CHRD domain-containing protein [Candidatus Hodarchaeota archaeon]